MKTGEHPMSTTTAPLLDLPDAALARAQLLLERAQWAAAGLVRLDHAAVAAIVTAVAKAGFAKAGHYADWAVRETGYGVAAHKRLKNEICSQGILAEYGDIDYVSPRIDEARKMIELPRPAGVILGLTPVTNPVATLYFKVLLALMTRNAIVISPHPGARECSVDAVNLLAEAAIRAGAPKGSVQVVAEPSIPLVHALMSDSRIDLIAATGGPAVVKAAYRSGNPAYGVGPGNAPVLVDGTTDAALTAQRIVDSKSFDNSVLCTNESTMVILAAAAARMRTALTAAGAHLCTPEQVVKLRAYLFPHGTFNVAALGKSAEWIAREAGLGAITARILVAAVDRSHPEEPLAREKLCPVLAMVVVDTLDDAFVAARSTMRAGGRGHSAAIHSDDPDAVLRFAAAVPALRIVVNAGCSQGAAGLDTHLGPSMTIGTGFAGGSSIGENLRPEHFLNFARVAYHKAESEAFPRLTPQRVSDAVTSRKVPTSGQPPEGNAAHANMPAFDDVELRRELRRIILEELQAALAA